MDGYFLFILYFKNGKKKQFFCFVLFCLFLIVLFCLLSWQLNSVLWNLLQHQIRYGPVGEKCHVLKSAEAPGNSVTFEASVMKTKIHTC